MKKLCSFKSALLTSAVALSVLASPASAVKREDVENYFYQNLGDNEILDDKVLDNLEKFNETQWGQFKTTVQSLTKGIDGWERARVIAALGKLDWKILFHTEFSKGITTFLNFFDNGGDKSLLIQEIAKHQYLFQNPESVSYYDLFRQLRGESSLVRNNSIVNALSQVCEDAVQNEQFFPTLTPLITEGMYEDSRAEVIKVVGNVSKDKMDLVYGQIQRLMRETSNKICFTKHEAVQEFIQQLQGDKSKESDDEAVAFTTDLIAKINDHKENVDDNLFSVLEGKAWARMWELSQAKIQAQARQGQTSTNSDDNTSHKEVNAPSTGTQNVITENTKDPTLTLKRRSLSPFGNDRDVE